MSLCIIIVPYCLSFFVCVCLTKKFSLPTERKLVLKVCSLSLPLHVSHGSYTSGNLPIRIRNDDSGQLGGGAVNEKSKHSENCQGTCDKTH